MIFCSSSTAPHMHAHAYGPKTPPPCLNGNPWGYSPAATTCMHTEAAADGQANGPTNRITQPKSLATVAKLKQHP